tara:strand:- start:142 stop:387 length:246 start_codon:yes stop_codon:yes gene_type:complete
VLPDYQGIGIGVRFINEVSKNYKDNGWNVNLTTTTPSLIHVLARGEDWLLKRRSRVKNNHEIKSFKKSSSENRMTYSFNFK